MTVSCYFCKSKDKTLSYHIFPIDLECRKQWLHAFNFEEDDIFKNTRICSRHFSYNCFSITEARPRLKRSSIPTLHLSKKKKRYEVINIIHCSSGNQNNESLINVPLESKSELPSVFMSSNNTELSNVQCFKGNQNNESSITVPVENECKLSSEKLLKKLKTFSGEINVYTFES